MNTTHSMAETAPAEDTNSCETMLDIAATILRCRATLDGEDEIYDLSKDPEGYVNSVLTSLMHWCHANGIEWLRELGNAWHHFQTDLQEAGQFPTDKDDPMVRDLRCPECGHEGDFVIEVSECLLMFSDGVALHGDGGEEWGLGSYCRCYQCDHSGMVYQFYSMGADAEGETRHG